MRRWTYHLLASVSLLICVGMAVLWIRSYFAYDDLLYKSSIAAHAGERRTGVESQAGFLIFYHSVNDQGFTSSGIREVGYWITYSAALEPGLPSPLDAVDHRFAGFGYKSEVIAGRSGGVRTAYNNTQVMIPFWFLVALFSLVPARWMWRRRRDRSRRRAGSCRHCGYDLRATPDRCPECGHQVPERPAYTMENLSQSG